MQSLQDAVDEAAERTGFSGVVRVDRSGETELCHGLRVRRPGPRGPEHGRDPVRDRERDEDPDGAGGDEPGRARDARARHDRPLAARRRPAADRRRRDGRAPAGAPVRDRRLPRRGRRRRRHRLRDAGPGARARDDRAVPAGAGRARDRCSPPASGSPTTTAATSCSRCWPSGRAAWTSTSWSAPWSASRRAWSTPRSCAPTSSRDAPPAATSSPTA